MTLPLSLNEIEPMPASAGHGSRDTDPMEKWLEAALDLAAPFPPGQISIGQAQQARALSLLDDVHQELTTLGHHIVEYFETSRPRYEYTLSLALAQTGGRVLDV